MSAEKRLVLDTVNEVGSALLDLVPWRAREGLDRLVADANQRYRQADDTITQRVQLVQAAIQRSQQVVRSHCHTWAGIFLLLPLVSYHLIVFLLTRGCPLHSFVITVRRGGGRRTGLGQ